MQEIKAETGLVSSFRIPKTLERLITTPFHRVSSSAPSILDVGLQSCRGLERYTETESVRVQEGKSGGSYPSPRDGVDRLV